MALSSASRASVIHHLDVRYMLRPKGKFVFTIHKLHKSWKYGKAPPSLEFCEYTEDRDFCVVTTLNEYIKRTYQRRAEKRRCQLLLSFVQPYVEVSSTIISRWIKEALKLAGIDVSIFKGHSARATSSSKASKAGLSLAENRFWLILICALSRGWRTVLHSDKSRLGEFNIRSTENL